MSNTKRYGLILITSLLLGCALSTTSKQWKLKWDEELIAEKQTFLETLPRQSDQKERPNVILIVADDLGKYEVSAYGAEHIETTHIDQLAEEGVLFKDAYVTAPICSPSRAAMLTGKYQQRYGFETQPMEYYPSNFLEYNQGKNAKFLGDWRLVTDPSYPSEWELPKQGVPPSEINLAEVMQSSGYQTGIIGKWHLGYGKEHLPNNRGFDYQYGFYGAFSLYTPTQKTPGYVNYIQDDLSARHQWETKRNETAAIRENDKVVKEEDYLTFAIRDRSISFIEKHKEEPFFLYVPFNAPHVPFQAPQSYYDQFDQVKDKNKRVYLAMIKALDDAIGDILQKVKATGLEENTIIYFLSDNGGASYTGATENGPLKGGKITHFEGGINVPFIMKWKDHIPEGIQYVHPVSSMDIFTTTIKNCHIPWEEERTLDGVDLVPFIMGERSDKPHDVLYWRTDHIRAIQSEKWKLILSTRDQWMHLYDLETDKSERIDLKDMHPDKIEELKSYFDVWNEELPEDPLWPRLMDRRFIIDSTTYYFPA